MDRVTRARLAAGVALAGAAALGALALWAASVALLSVGLMTLLLVTERDVPAGLADSAVAGDTAALATLSRALRLEGNGILIPGGGPTPSALFVPARPARLDELPPLAPEVVLQREGPGALGAHIPAPGAGLERRWAAEHGLPEGRGAEEATAHLRKALPALALGRDVVVARSRGSLRVAYEPLEFAATCRATREDLAPWHLQGACPACSFVVILVARAHAAPVRIQDAGIDGPRVFLDLEVGARSRA